jgi:hypothetical protein
MLAFDEGDNLTQAAPHQFEIWNVTVILFFGAPVYVRRRRVPHIEADFFDFCLSDFVYR